MTTTTALPPLSPRQREAFDFICSNMALYSPTVREIAAAMGIKSPHGVSQHLDALEKKGYIRRKKTPPGGSRWSMGNDKPYELPSPSVVAEMCAIQAWMDHIDDDSRLLHEMSADTIRLLMQRTLVLAKTLELVEYERDVFRIAAQAKDGAA